MVAVDRISDLPTEIIHHIMFFLPLLDVIQMSVLSRRFNSIWRTFPVIELDQELFVKMSKRLLNQSHANNANVHKEKLIQKLMLFSDDFLRRRRGPDIFFSKLKLRNLCIPNIDRYIDFASENRIQDMEVNYSFLRATTFSINLDIFAVKSIRVLKLTGLDLGLQNLILRDSSIEELSLKDCYVPETITVVSDKLLSLELRYCSRLQNIEIDAPNLQSFTYDGGYQPSEININAPESLKSLSLRNALITDSWIEENVFKFISLENLSINGCRNLKKVKICLPQLKNFEFLYSRNEVELELELITPNLVSFLYTGVLPLHTILTSTRFEARLSLTGISATIEWFLALRHLLMSLDYCKVLTLQLQKQVVFPKELKDRWIAPVFCIKHLRVKVSSFSMSYRDLVALLLQLSPRPNTLSIIQSFYFRDSIERVIKFKYAKKVAEENSSCCKRLLVKCWRHYLTNITMENFEDVNDKEDLVMFFKDIMKMSGSTRVENEKEKLIIWNIH